MGKRQHGRLWAFWRSAHRPYRASGNERGCPPDMKGPMMLMADRAGHPSGLWDFAEFALCHAACEEELLEVRLDEASIMCWCLRCKELRIFAKARYVDDPAGCPERTRKLPGK